MIATNVRRLGLYLMFAFAIVSASIAWWQVIEADRLAVRPDNPEVIAARQSLPRDTIFDATGQVLASSSVVEMTAPPTESEWPLRNFVVECTTMSAPSSIGRWRYGEQNVLSTTTSAPP